MKINIEHCCMLMSKFTQDARIGVHYSPIFRDYTINLIGSCAVQTIYHCPWCGAKLPYCLDEKYYEVLEKEYGINNPCNEKQEKLIPEEFKSDTWWKKRNL